MEKTVFLETVREQKLRQVQELLIKKDIPVWAIIQHVPIFTSTDVGRDPVIRMLAAPSAFEFAVYIIAPDAAYIFYDYHIEEPVNGGWLIQRSENPLKALSEWLSERDIQIIAVNIDPVDPMNDGLSASLAKALATETQRTLTSSSKILTTLWQVMTPAEVKGIKNAQYETAAALHELGGDLKIGWKHEDIATWLRCWGASRNYTPGWAEDWVQPPVVGFGLPDHNHDCVMPGQTMYIDYSFSVDGFCSDLQRTYYVPFEGEDQVPASVEKDFAFGMDTLDRIRRACRPGVSGEELFEEGASILKKNRFRLAFPHLGHPIGRSVNIPGALLEPRSLNATRAAKKIQVGEVYALGLRYWKETGNANIIGVEEVVYVGESETSYLSPVQTKVWQVSA